MNSAKLAIAITNSTTITTTAAITTTNCI